MYALTDAELVSLVVGGAALTGLTVVEIPIKAITIRLICFIAGVAMLVAGLAFILFG